MRKLQVRNGKFKGKLTFKCFACGRVGHHVSKCPYKYDHEKGKNVPKRNVRRIFYSNKIFYSNEDSQITSDNQEILDSDSNKCYQVLMALEYQWSESNSCEVDDLVKELEENDKLMNGNKDMETKESSMIREINMLRMELEACNRRT